MAKKKIKKAQKGTEVTADSTAYLKKDIKMYSDLAMVHAKYGDGKAAKKAMQQSKKAREDLARQGKKGKRYGRGIPPALLKSERPNWTRSKGVHNRV